MNKKEENKHVDNQCFVIMPISDPKEYDLGHFKCVYEDIFIPAIKDAGFDPKRADDDKSSSMIQVSIIKDIIESPMAICDLSTRNPNVLFELGIRQAFDLPVVLVQETDTPRIFDISTINTIDYRKNLTYREVIEDREKIKKAILETKDNTKGVNSIVQLLGIEAAKKKDGMGENTILYSISNQIMSIMNKLDKIEVNRHEGINTSDLSKSGISIVYDGSAELDKRFDEVEYRYKKADNIDEYNSLTNDVERLIIDYNKSNFLSEPYKALKVNKLLIMRSALVRMANEYIAN